MQYRVPEVFAGMEDEDIRVEMEEYGLIGPGDSDVSVMAVKSAAGYEDDTSEMYNAEFEPALRAFREVNGFEDSPYIDPDLAEHAQRINNIWIRRQVQ